MGRSVVFRSPGPDVPIPRTSLTAFVFENAERMASRPALIDGPTGRVVTYAELLNGARRLARGLSNRGFQKGEVFGIYAPNLPEYAVAFHGVAAIGGVSTTINPSYTKEELARQLRDSGARFLLTMPPLVATARGASEGTSVEEVFAFGEADGATPFQSLLSNDGDAPEVDIDPESDLVALPFSSGTTGLQKGVMLTHGNLVANLVQTAALHERIDETDVAMGLLPFFHIYGLVVVLNLILRHGATIVTMPRFDLEQFLSLIAKHRVTVAHVVPPIVLALSKHPIVERYDLSSLRWILSGAAPLGKELIETCSRRLGFPVLQGYGLTETSPVTHGLSESDDRPGSIGRLVAGTECKVVDPSSGEALGPDKDGELWIRGPQVMKGYLNQPAATAQVIDADGFFHSGDIGHADDEGYFYIVDRLKELIKYKGLQVAPAELEALLLSHPGVADAAVIPIPDEEAGEVPKAFVVPRGDVTEEALMAFVAEHVAPYKKIRALEMVDQIPKSPSGKILRRVLVEREREKRTATT
ncbi:MAG: 4-coumarate--CoA ligase family protein [Vicinamibacteria bacterium]